MKQKYGHYRVQQRANLPPVHVVPILVTRLWAASRRIDV
jgi:hypothetical protein